jgi:hypothetical protein
MLLKIPKKIANISTISENNISISVEDAKV